MGKDRVWSQKGTEMGGDEGKIMEEAKQPWMCLFSYFPKVFEFINVQELRMRTNIRKQDNCTW